MSADLNSILQMMVANPGQGMDAAARQALLSQFAEDDPTLNMLATYLSQSGSASDDEKESADDHSIDKANCAAELHHARERSEQTAEAVRELREQIEKLFAELEMLRERNDALAQALGSCALCWGDDVECPICGGAGQPGFTAPDRRMFAELLGPVVSRLRKRAPGSGPFPFAGSKPEDATH